MADSKQDVKPDAKSEDNSLTLRVTTASGNEMFFKVKKTTLMSKVQNAFCERQGLDVNSVKFLFDGQTINPNDTPQQLGLEDDDAIDVVQAQTGGFF